MRAIIFDGKLRLVDNYPKPIPPPGEALVRMLIAGICNTDIEITRGYTNFHGVLGHEFVGEIAGGTRVVGEINTYDGTCSACQRGDVTHCENRTTLGIHNRDGAFAEYFCLPQQNLIPVPSSITNEEAIFVEPIAAALEITDRLHIKPTHHVALIGDGKLGLLCAQVIALTGCHLLVIGHHESKMAFLINKGISITTQPQRLASDFDIVIEATGNQQGFTLAQQIIHPRGTLVLKSTFHGNQEINLSPLVVKEITLIGSRCGPFHPALRLLERKLIDVKPLISAVFPLSQGLEAFESALQKGARKVSVCSEDISIEKN